jgi:hypothetical protein
MAKCSCCGAYIPTRLDKWYGSMYGKPLSGLEFWQSFLDEVIKPEIDEASTKATGANPTP